MLLFILNTAALFVSPWTLAFLTGLILIHIHRLYTLTWNTYVFLRCSYYFLCLYLPLLFPICWKMREECFLGPQDSCHFRLFPVSIHDAIITSSFSNNVSLSSVRIPIHLCMPEVQKTHKTKRCQSKLLKRHSLCTLLLGLFTFSSKHQQVYSLPGSSHLLVPEKSLDSNRQQSLADTAVTNAVNSAVPPTGTSNHAPTIIDQDPVTTKTDSSLSNLPFCFLCDTDSIPHLADTGANRIILNNPRMVTNFKAADGGVKGIDGALVPIAGVGKYDFPLRSDKGVKHNISVPVVCVPSSPFCLFPPQLLHKLMQEEGFDVRQFKHDDKKYILEYRPPNEKSWHKMTIPVDQKGMFTHWGNPGYTRFLGLASTYDSSWVNYPGHAYFIKNNSRSNCSNHSSISTELQPGQMREPFTNHKPPDDKIPSSGSTTTQTEGAVRGADPNDHEVSEPIRVGFDQAPSIIPPDDPAIRSVQNKQHRLSVLHERYGHLSFPKLQLMARSGLIPRELANVEPPTCPGCAYGKAHRKPWRTKGARNRHPIKPATYPGQTVSVDQLISPTPGFVPTHRGKPTTTRYIGATVFVDHFTDFTYVHLMSEMNAEATVDAKRAFERVCAKHGVVVRHYHADNGLFDTQKFKLSVEQAGQSLTFCGVNAHHQNGKAERRIKDVTEGARTALLHAVHRWPKAIDASLWPAALKNYVNLRNSLPSDFTPEQKIGKRIIPARFEGSPISKMSGVEVEPNLRDFHPFGSPVYVLEESLQAQHSHNKWQDRTCVGIFLCHSPDHASSVPLVLNTRTGLVSPQFHCIYDDAFDTCRNDAKFESLWQHKAKLDVSPTPDVRLVSTTDPMQRTSMTSGSEMPPIPQFIHQWDQPSWDHEEITMTDTSAPPSVHGGADDEASLAQQPVVHVPVPVVRPTPVVTRTGRMVVPNRFIFNDDMVHANTAHLNTFSLLSTDISTHELLQPSDGIEPHPLAFAVDHIYANAVSADPDVMTFEEAMRCPDREKFIEAMHKELNDHINRRHWKVVPAKSVPRHKRAIPMVWSMKRKRDPVGTIVKWKARLCAGGHRSIENVDYWATYSPVVSWSTVRLAIIFALINSWYIESIDFVLAYPQAPVQTDIYMVPPKVPQGFLIPDLPNFVDRFTNVYKLLKNLYGLKDAGKTWNDHLCKGLLARGWVPSTVDPCLYTKPGIVLVVYVDDACLLSPHKELIRSEILSLKVEFQLTDEGELRDYLGTRFTKNNDGSLTLTQPRMMHRILELVGLDQTADRTKVHDTPASSTDLLDRDPDGHPHTYKWNYRAVVGSLSYLQAMIRPDITMAVQQCARFCNDPQQQHAEAVKRICRYLLRTKDNGLVFRPDRTRGLECFVDADWAGSWRRRSCTDPLSARSRTGYIILYAGCPIVWASKMQTLVALSTTEAEYIALSSSLREVIGILNLLQELQQRGFNLNLATPTVHCTVFEDNRSCIEIATNHRTRPRTKHLSVRLHHFRSHVLAKTIAIKHISTTNQLADLFTKPLARDAFVRLRNRFMGWESSP